MTGRSLGPGSLKRVQRGSGPPQLQFTYTDAKGQRHRPLLGTDKRVAQMRATEIIRQRDMQLAGLASVEGMNTPLAELRDLYLADLATRAVPAHLKNTTATLDRMLREVKAVRVRDLRAIDALQARARLVKQDLAPRTCNLHVDKLRAMLTWAVDAGLIAQSPLGRIKKLPDGDAHATHRRRALTDEEISRLLEVAETDDRENDARVAAEAASHSRRTLRHRGVRIPQRPFWAMLLECGCRYGEARTLTWSDIDFGRCTAVLRPETTKSSRVRCIPLRRVFVDELARLRDLHARALGQTPDACDKVFLSPERRPHREDSTNARRVLYRLLERAGIERIDGLGRHVDIHALRGTCATVLARRGVGISINQRLLGHRDPKLTAKHYIDLGVDDMRAAIEGAKADRAASPRAVRANDMEASA